MFCSQSLAAGDAKRYGNGNDPDPNVGSCSVGFQCRSSAYPYSTLDYVLIYFLSFILLFLSIIVVF